MLQATVDDHDAKVAGREAALLHEIEVQKSTSSSLRAEVETYKGDKLGLQGTAAQFATKIDSLRTELEGCKVLCAQLEVS